MNTEINFEWLDVEDIVWDIFDKNQSKWGHSFNECKNKIIALNKAKELTRLFSGTNESKDLSEIIDMKINCLIRDYYVPVMQRIKSEIRAENLNMALFLAHSELRNITASQEIFLNSSKIIDELKAQCKKLEDGNRITNTVSNKSKEVVE
jgi:hypothetical protein